LKKHNFDALNASSEVEASFQMGEVKPVLAIMDSAMAERGVFDIVKGAGPDLDIPTIIVIEKNADVSGVHLEEYFSDYIKKPITEEKLMEVVKKALGGAE
jgi:two-component SAPR family response regulator